MKKSHGIILALLAFIVFWQVISALVHRPFLPGPLAVTAVLFRLAASRSKRLGNLISPFIYIFSQMLVTVRDSAKQVAGEYLDVVRSMGAGKTAIIRHVIIPSVLPGFFTGHELT